MSFIIQVKFLSIALLHCAVALFSYAALAGDCSRARDGYSSYSAGVGTGARIVQQEHGYQLKDGSYALFVDDRSCARTIKMDNKAVGTFIGMFIVTLY